MATDTTYTLDQFLADTRATIKGKGVPAGLAEIRDHLEKLLHNPGLLEQHLGDPPFVRVEADPIRAFDREIARRGSP